MEGANTDSLRSAAPQWNLAGDKQLLEILQNIHQSLMTKCQEVNNRLDEMVTALDGASVDLQNVNNKFMALSNSQFIESRVYDDDADIAAQEEPKKTPAPEMPSDLEQMKASVRSLQELHETIQIVESDSDSDTDEDLSKVLKPKDLYAHRPLPHIIGSNRWMNKWHAGLLPDDSDSDSSISKHEDQEMDEYSDSEPEVMQTDGRTGLTVPDAQGSTASSDFASEQELPSSTIPGAPVPPPSAADVAAEIARRLGGHKLPILEQDEQYSPAPPTTNRVYRPEKPSASRVFSDEPPPLDTYQSEGDDYSEEEDDDIFAELHKSKPYAYSNKEQSRVAEDLFGPAKQEREVFDEFRDQPPPPLPSKQKSTLFDDESEPELFANKPSIKPEAELPEAGTTKKPVGGISLFGSNKGAESIGAAILKRNRRKSSTDEDIAGEEPPKPVIKQEAAPKNKEKDIFDDLFAKSAREQKPTQNKENNIIKKEEDVKIEKKVDLFSDNLFDDIDDIFTSNVSVKKPSKAQKSLFDDDDDDLFSDIAVKTDTKNTEATDNNKKSIFDSDDDLFTEKTVKKPELSEPRSQKSESMDVNEHFKGKSIFVNDNLTEKKLVGNTTIVNCKVDSEVGKMENTNVKAEEIVIASESEINETERPSAISNVSAKLDSGTSKSKNQSLFEDDDDSDTLFANTSQKPTITDKPKISSKPIKSIQSEKQKSKQESSLFDDDDDTMFFTSEKSQKAVKHSVKSDSIFPNAESNLKHEETSEEPIDDFATDDTLDNYISSISNIDVDNSNTKRDAINTDNVPQSKSSQDDNEVENNLFVNNDQKSINTHNTDVQANINVSDETKSLPVSKINGTDQLTDNIVTNDVTTKDAVTSDVILDDVLKKQFNDKPVKNALANDDPQHSNIDPVDKQIEPEIRGLEFIDPKPLNDDPFANTVKDALFGSPNESILNTPDIFSNIIDEPPAFEKPKEPKKSKNINALFDDDSDDEALFFKKNDVVLDEKPDFSTDSKTDALFGMFHDEPPAMDVDFSQKTNKSNNISDDFLLSDSDDDFFQVPKSAANVSKPAVSSERTQNEVFKTRSQIEIISDAPSKADVSNYPHESKVYDQKTEPTKPKPDVRDGSAESKKIGKLKSMNININVNTLLPGASPKKKQPVEQTDGAVVSSTGHESPNTNDKLESSLIKSVSFDGKPDSQVLDNKISKGRAKIQVKRRPSTRRARQEAVRKSAIDFGEDSTDNSSSIDDPPKVVNTEDTDYVDNDRNASKVETNVEEITASVDAKEKHITPTDDEVSNIKSNDIEQIEDLLTDKQPPEETVDIDKSVGDSAPKETTIVPVANETAEYKRDVKSKVVYILNDEDIFNTNVEKTQSNTKNVMDLFDDNDDGDDLFKSKGNCNETESSVRVYRDSCKEDTEKTNTNKNPSGSKLKKSLFDDLSEDDSILFNTNKKAAPKSKGILDSDSEEDLFGGKSRKETKVEAASVKETKHANAPSVKEIKPVDVKASLFGDDVDEDDLFGAKARTAATAPSQSTKQIAKDTFTKSSEPVFDDPLSLLGGDD